MIKHNGKPMSRPDGSLVAGHGLARAQCVDYAAHALERWERRHGKAHPSALQQCGLSREQVRQMTIGMRAPGERIDVAKRAERKRRRLNERSVGEVMPYRERERGAA